MDAFALQAANAVVGNLLDSAALEWALGGGSIRFDTECMFAIAGARTLAAIAGNIVPPLTTTQARSGDELTIEQITSGRFLYIAFSGGIDVPMILESRSTYLPGRFGGYQGRMIATNDTLMLGTRPASVPSEGFACAADLLPRYEVSVAHITRGTHADMFDDSAWRTLTETEYRVSTASDRTGYKLKGVPVSNRVATLPSEASCPGSIQIPGDGAPIVLMADAPTVGGYPKIAVVAEADLPIVAQRSPGDALRFELITIEQSQRALKRRASDLHTIAQLAIRSSHSPSHGAD